MKNTNIVEVVRLEKALRDLLFTVFIRRAYTRYAFVMHSEKQQYTGQLQLIHNVRSL